VSEAQHDKPDGPLTAPPRRGAGIDRDGLIDAVRNDPELRKALLQALFGAA
jgi:hypothetical protein